MDLAKVLARQSGLTIQVAGLAAQVARAAVMEERRRMARELHDTLAQGFVGIIFQLEAAEAALRRPISQKVQTHLRRARELAHKSLGEARRAVRALRPQSLQDGGLCAALERLLREMTAGTALRAQFHRKGRERPLPRDLEEHLLRISQEALTNTLRHARAASFDACLAFAPDEVQLDLRDDGRGFNPRRSSEGSGLKGMRERADRIGARLRVWSTAGEGTGIRVAWPKRGKENGD
jgi:signal transduction histidine kinase